MDPCDDLTDEDIRTAIQNATGPKNVLFVPEVLFCALARWQASICFTSIIIVRYILVCCWDLSPFFALHIFVACLEDTVDARLMYHTFVTSDRR